MNRPTDSPLGRAVAYPETYDPSLLFPIARADKRAELGLAAPLPFAGVDVWNAYELSWLDARGKPAVALAELRVPADSPRIVESKSLKLYLNGYTQTRFDAAEAVRTRIAADLAAATGAEVAVTLLPAARFGEARLAPLAGACIDDLDLAIDDYGPPRPEYLATTPGAEVEEALVSNLLKSNCPVTGQPDWASVQIRYAGAPIDRAGLLRYLVSFRRHSDFHEQCVERIFVDLLRRCAPRRLAVYARYTRRGGLDINPFRATPGYGEAGNPRTARQ
ncbi:NADPH-dependent 7-cyano-7-deazaguanine reductase QueF [Mizugakiibacter sediminis]|uniref:NADPH-dependent 7-cyano-7-deazaguanine reductase n=1 Tax=Mizugakiibacter sediminis TaxID=1475481 RepID=A0A0U1PC06_9GAMM|nr:NADPH-dependent 7-cyano-7-deazaguanine reductase QueF [Mizugakiibacter sediminis]